MTIESWEANGFGRQATCDAQAVSNMLAAAPELVEEEFGAQCISHLPARTDRNSASLACACDARSARHVTLADNDLATPPCGEGGPLD